DAFAACSPAAASARAALTVALETFLKLLAPTLPFATEEVWSWWREGSVHRAPWPTSQDLPGPEGGPGVEVLDAAGAALSALRKVKSDAKVSQRTVIESVDILVPEAQVAGVNAAREDLMAAGRVTRLQVVDAVA